MPPTSAAAAPRGLTIALLPLDERPVNIALPAGIAAIAGAELVLPPIELWPAIRTPGKADAMAQWLEEIAGKVDAVVVSLDTLAFGGLIAARTTLDSLGTALDRLAALGRVRADHPHMPIAAVSLVMRATNSYNPQEEPLYWAEMGKELHHLGALHHKDHLQRLGALPESGNAAELAGLRAALSPDILADFELRRLRNHQVNLHALGLAATGILDPLLITADDTAEFAAGSVEQLWLDQWMRVLPPGGQVLMYPGADEVAGVLVARQLSRLSGVVASFELASADPEGMDRIAKYENSPIRTAIDRQLRASGATLVPEGGTQVLVIHTPDPKRRDFVHDVITFDEPDRAAALATADLVSNLLASGRSVALADLRYANGGDPNLVDLLIARGAALQLAAYGGWNTAGNSLGSVVAAAAASQIGGAAGTLDAGAQRKMLLHRLLEDHAYQSVLRPALERRLDAEHGTRKYGDAALEAQIVAQIGGDLAQALERFAPGAQVRDIAFPWHRSFEIDFVIDGGGP